MKNISKFYFVIAIFSILMLSCGAGAKRAKPGAEADKRTLAEPKFDPLGGEGDEEVITLDVPLAKEAESSDNITTLPQRQEPAKQAGQYFSVQLFASKSSSEAKEFKNSISSLFDEDIKIDYQAPYYRVCVGRASGLEQAEELLRRVNSMGFPKAWLVRVRK